MTHARAMVGIEILIHLATTPDAGHVYAHTYGLHVMAIRCGWCARDPAHAEQLAANPYGKGSYLSPGDAGRCFAAAIEGLDLPTATGHTMQEGLR